MASGIRDPRILKVVAIGPTRRFQERAGTEDAPELDYYRRREMRYMRLSQTIPTPVFLKYRASLAIENRMEYLSGCDHKPVLLIDGMLESSKNHLFLQRIYDSMVEPKGYVTLPDADHYANVANFGPVVIYDRLVVAQLVYEIEAWLSQD